MITPAGNIPSPSYKSIGSRKLQPDKHHRHLYCRPADMPSEGFLCKKLKEIQTIFE
jgi:hypothetical protein